MADPILSGFLWLLDRIFKINGSVSSEAVQKGEMTPEQALANAAASGSKLSPEQESYLSSMLAKQRTNEARDYETMMANTDLLRAADQLQALGLSPNNVLQTGGSATPNVAAASTPSLQNANQRFNRFASLAGALIGMTGRMASAGIYGNAYAGVKSAAAKASSAAAHSAPYVLNAGFDPNMKMSDSEIDNLLKDFM